MQKYYLTNTVWIDRDTERELANNGEYGDARVRLCTAQAPSGTTHYYLQTNGDPVVLYDDDSDHNREWLETLGLEVEEVIALITHDGQTADQEWAIDQLRQVQRAADEE